ncbi:MAG: phosphoribosylanthranilate isomerase [Thermoleophilaceae bacterium]|jgi:phosphoribosylanthranilate isomerase|nr:phosphoribosylanthranilate isomerase [Thermoleophilaceae bacterium]
MTKVKLCGITSLDDARLCADAGAWALGHIFWAGSPRRCEVEEAERISAELRRKVEIAGVFFNSSLDEVAEIVDAANLSLVQLHGDEGPAYCAEIARRTGAKVIKAVRARDKASIRALLSYRDRVDYHLVDAYKPDVPGGTGETFSWELIDELRDSGHPLVLSGGLTPANVGDAIAKVHPFAVDTASGTEAEPGRKDPAKVAAFMRAVEQASRVAA